MATLRTLRGGVLAFVLGMLGVPLAGAQQVSLAVDQGPLPASAPVSVTVYLPTDGDKEEALRHFLSDVQDPTSAEYHHWLTPGQFGQRFGASADALSSVRVFAENNGLSVAGVSANGLRVTLAGTETQMEAAFAPGLHKLVTGNSASLKVTKAAVTPDVLKGVVFSVGTFETTNVATPAGALEQLSAAVESNDAPVVVIKEPGITAEAASAFVYLAEEASAQGITVLVTSDHAQEVSAGDFADVTAVATTPGLSAGIDAWASRPSWQNAVGLPNDGLRHQPDVTATSIVALAQTLRGILATLPANADGTAARLGNVTATLYAMAAEPGVYEQPDGGAGTWEPLTGLGLVDLAALAKFFPRGALVNNVSLSASNYAPTHGQTITLSSTVSDTSGNGNGVVPTGSVTFTTSSGLTLGSANLVNGTGAISINSLAGGTYSVTANYSGDATYVAGHSVAANVSVQGEAAALSASVGGSVPVGGTITVNATVSSPSGVGTPTGSITVQPQGTNNNGTYTGALTASTTVANTSTGSTTLPATQAGNIVLLVNCVSADPSFTCYTPVHVNQTVTQASSKTALTVSPNPPVNQQTTTFTASVTGAASPAPLPTGDVTFYDNGTQIGTGTLTNGTATFTSSSISGTVAHSFSASYVGDANYTASVSSATTTSPTQGPTTTTLTVSPNPPVYGTTTTLTATIAYTSIGTFPTGTVTFFMDGAQVGTGAVASNATASFTSTAITGTSSHVFYAVYNGDTNYSGSTSSNVATQSGSAVATTTSLSINPNPPVNGQQTTLTATVAYTSNGAAATGTVQFYEDGAVIGSGVVNASGVATYQSSALSATTTHSFYAKYSGDVNYQPSQSNTVVTQAGGSGASVSTTTTIASSATQVAPGGMVTLTATVTPQSVVNNTQPTGTVTFTSSVQGALGTAPVTNGVAMLQVALTSAGSQNVSAAYGGDTNYKASSSSTPVTITVAVVTTPLTVTLNPATGAQFDTQVTAIAAVSGVATTDGKTPAGTVTFSIAGTTGLGATVALTGTTATAASASYSFVAPAPGTYTVTATCTGTNFTCSTTGSTASLVTVKGSTTTTLTALPAVPVAGQPTLLTATIAAPNAVAGTTPVFTGMVTFYVNGTSAGTGTIAGNTATFSTTLNATTANIVTAVYSGDTNWATSTAPALTLTTPPAPTTTTLSSNATTVLQSALVIFTANISTGPTAANPTPGTPSGTVTFYDVYNGQTVALGTSPLQTTGPYTAVGQLSTTGLFTGIHTVTAVFSNTATFGGSTSNADIVTVQDYSLAISPGSLTLTRGTSGTATISIGALSGFTGTVSLSCTPPAGTETTCTVNPTTITTSGAATLTIATTAPHAKATQQSELKRTGLGMGVSLAAGMLCLLWPRRRRPSVLVLMVVLCGLTEVVGCGSGSQLIGPGNGGGTTADPGTPLGTQSFTITTSGNNGLTTNRHTVVFPVVVQ